MNPVVTKLVITCVAFVLFEYVTANLPLRTILWYRNGNASGSGILAVMDWILKPMCQLRRTGWYGTISNQLSHYANLHPSDSLMAIPQLLFWIILAPYEVIMHLLENIDSIRTLIICVSVSSTLSMLAWMLFGAVLPSSYNSNEATNKRRQRRVLYVSSTLVAIHALFLTWVWSYKPKPIMRILQKVPVLILLIAVLVAIAVAAIQTVSREPEPPNKENKAKSAIDVGAAYTMSFMAVITALLCSWLIVMYLNPEDASKIMVMFNGYNSAYQY